ncbi:MAG: AmmeMemoRadiSam system protein B [Bacteroidales bacterium]|nr:AmmeMemoRadiSam system protein B [Bacteroidales bacterium]
MKFIEGLKNIIIILMAFNYSNCNSQHSSRLPAGEDRAAAVAGQFYPSDSRQLENKLDSLFALSKAEVNKNNTVAIIAPHAGYVFSGKVAASAFNQIAQDKNYDNIFILASSHRNYYDGASIYSKGDFIIPSGTVQVNRKLAESLKKQYNVLNFDENYHKNEHSLEVQLPFIHKKMKKAYKIVPILIGTDNPSTCKQIAEALSPYFNNRNLFVVSTDFSHYPSYSDANYIDKITADAILSNSSIKLLNTLNENKTKNINGLSTSLCGWTSVLTLLYITEKMQDVKYNHILYQNSGDVKEGGKEGVVGYHSIAVTIKDDDFKISNEDKKALLKVARTTIEKYIKEGKTPDFNKEAFSDKLSLHQGAFVTLHKDGQLRGCIGKFKADIPLYLVVRDMAIAAATEDTRFNPVTKEEIPKIEIEISVLSPMKKINSIDEIILGKHGIYIKKGYNGGTFLPQVATETGWSKEEFLGHCARDKAGIGWDGWKDKDTEIFIYSAIVFGE